SELGACPRAGNSAYCAGRKHRRFFERVQIKVTPRLAATTRKTELGKASEAALAMPGEPLRLPETPPFIVPERVEVGPRLGLDREIDDCAHRRSSAAVTQRRQGDR